MPGVTTPHMMTMTEISLPTPGAWRSVARDAAGPVPHHAGPGQDRPLLEILESRAERWPGLIVADDGQQPVTWPHLLGMARALAERLAAQPQADGPVGLLMRDSTRAAAALFSGLLAGVPLLLLDPASPPARNAELIAIAGARVLLCDRGDDPLIAAGPGVPVVLADQAIAPQTSAPRPSGALGLDDVAFIMTTSGSTGVPKLVAYSQRLIGDRALQFGAAFGLVAGDRTITGTGALTAYTALSYLCAAIHAGATTHIGSIAQLGIRGLFSRVRSHAITAMRGPVSMWRTLAVMPGAAEALATLRKVRLTSEAATWDDLALIRTVLPAGCRITNSYGSTEAGSFSWTIPETPALDPVRIAAGRPHAGIDAVVARDDGSPAAVDEAGNLWVRGHSVALGEYARGHVVPGRFRADPDDPGARVYDTGDIARMTADGQFVVLGRRDRMLKLNGLRVEPDEVEAALRRIPGVRDAAVLPVMRGGTTILAGWIVLGPDTAADAEPNPAAIREALRDRLPAYMMPSRIIPLPALPRLPNGKVDGVSLLAGLGSGG